MDNSKKNRFAEVVITDFFKDGHGKGSVDQLNGETVPVEVPFSIPGDQLEVILHKRHKGVIQSQLLRVIHSSPERIAARCVHFSHCGGCCWQQISYEKQLELKEKRILEHLQPYIQKSTMVYPIIRCDPPWNYRNKAELTFSTDKAMNRYLGFILHKSRGKVFNLSQCHLISDWMNHVVHLVREWWVASHLDAYHGMKDTGSLRTLTLRESRRTQDKMVILTVSGNPDFALKNEQLKSFVSILKENLESTSRLSIFLRIQQIAKGKPTNFYEMQLYGPDHILETMNYTTSEQAHLPFSFHISPTAFFQPNTDQAEKLYQKVVEMIKVVPDAVVYDLYCGTGTLGIFLAKHVKEVHGIELNPESVIDAKENIKMNQLTNVTIHQGDVAKILPVLLEDHKIKPDIVIVDPPRAGLDAKAVLQLLEINAPQIVYVSCNPVTQAHNLENFINAGYCIRAVQPVDQFPQTTHVENIVVLTR